MNADVKRRWVEALRSGQYTKAKLQLRRYDRHCCLGVLCDLHAIETGGVWNGNEYDGENSYLPSSVRLWAGLSATNPSVNSRHLAVANDGNKSFLEIADLIEAGL